MKILNKLKQQTRSESALSLLRSVFLFTAFFCSTVLPAIIYTRNDADDFNDKEIESAREDFSNRPTLMLTEEKQKPRMDYKIIGFASNNVRTLAKTWYDRLEDLGYDEHVIVAFDDQTIQYFDELNREHAEKRQQNSTTTGTEGASYFYRYDNFVLPNLSTRFSRTRVEMIFGLRWHYILSHLKNGTSILLSDIDNIFNRHLDLTKHPDFSDFDVLHSNGGPYPQDIFDQIGFTTCGCLNWLKATPPTIAFLEKFIERCGDKCDDQIVMSGMIANELGMEWDNENITQRATLALTGRSKVTNHTVKVLDRNWAFRNGGPGGEGLCPHTDNNWVAMPHSGSDLLKIPFNRKTHHLFKIAMFDHFDKTCASRVGMNNTKQVGSVSKKKPSEPLRPTNLEIVQKPKMVDIIFKDVSDGHREHPHMGALDADGKPGYLHDETFLHKNPPALNFPDEALNEACTKRDDDWLMMHNRVVVETEYDIKRNKSGNKRDKIFCLVYTIEQFHDRIPNLLETWAPKCDGFMVGSTKTDASIGAVNIPHEGPEEYNNIWQKVRSMWSYVYDNYYEKYDWFHIGGDDLFLLVENLRYYLESEEISTASNGGIYLPEGKEVLQTPLLLGRRFKFKGDEAQIYDSGGAGYTMNKAALKLLVTEGLPNYFSHRKYFAEDTMVAKLLKNVDTVLPYDTKDDAGGERYMHYTPGQHWSYRLPKNPKGDWYATYSIDIKEGPDHCSPQSISFHYVKGEMMKRLFALAYGLCPKELLKD